MFKKIIVGVLCIMVAFVFIGCNSATGGGPDYRSVRAYVGQDFYEQFDAKEYTIESFNLPNAKDFSYRYYEDEEAEGGIGERFFWINLKSTGKQHAQNALDQLIQLEFIDRVDFYYHGANPGELLN